MSSLAAALFLLFLIRISIVFLSILSFVKPAAYLHSCISSTSTRNGLCSCVEDIHIHIYVLCMYVYMYVCMYVYMCVCWMYVCMYVCISVCMYVSVYVCMYVCMYMHVCNLKNLIARLRNQCVQARKCAEKEIIF